jgi:hypothetical protein
MGLDYYEAKKNKYLGYSKIKRRWLYECYKKYNN